MFPLTSLGELFSFLHAQFIKKHISYLHINALFCINLYKASDINFQELKKHSVFSALL